MIPWVPPPGGWDAPNPPPEVLAAFYDLGVGGNWEGGTIDYTGRRWCHVPNVGWRPAAPRPYLVAGRVYRSVDGRRRRRRERLTRWAPAALLLAAALVCTGLAVLSWKYALAGIALAGFLLADLRRPW
jgi:hypothetical protein